MARERMAKLLNYGHVERRISHIIISFMTGLLQDYQFVLRNRLSVLAVIPVRHVGLGKGIAALNAMLTHQKIDDGPNRPEDTLHTASDSPLPNKWSRKAAASDDEYEVIGLLPHASATYLFI